MTFEEWSKVWDKMFTICKLRNDFRALLVHTINNYQGKWNRGK